MEQHYKYKSTQHTPEEATKIDLIQTTWNEIVIMSNNNYMNETIPMWVWLSGHAAPIASILVFMSPIPTIQKIQHDRTVGNLPLLPYSSMIASAYLWFVYGILRHQAPIWTSNGTGLILGLYYFVSFQKFAPKSSPTLPGSIQQHIQWIGVIVGIATLLPVLMPLLTSTIDSSEIIGKAGVVLCIGMFASPLAALQSVIVTKSARSIPLPFTIASIVNCFLWTIFGWFQVNDSNVYIPNLLGLLFGIIQAALKLYYSETRSKLEARDEEKMLQTDSAV